MKRVLVIRLSAMGDVAMASPVLSTVCRTYPDVTFDVLSTPFFEPFFEPLDNLHFIGTDIKKRKDGLRAIWQLYRQLSADTKYDAIVDLHDVLRTKVLRLLFRLSCRKIVKIDKGRSEKRRLTAAKNKRFEQLTPMINRYADTFAKAGFPISISDNYLSRRVMPSIDGITEKNGETWIGISPFAQHKGKIYPLDKMKSVVSLLTTKSNYRVFLFGGGAKEKAVAEEWAVQFENCNSVVGKLKLADEMALMSNLDCMLSMDSSAMHIASLFHVRVVSVWGATHHFAGFLGYGQSESDIVGLDLPCRPCSIYGNKPCITGDYKCFDISPEKIVNVITRNL